MVILPYKQPQKHYLQIAKSQIEPTRELIEKLKRKVSQLYPTWFNSI